jgi:hypothetical protein
MIIGAAVAVGTGVALVVVRQLAGLAVDPAKIAVKLLLATLVLAALIVAAIRRRAPSRSGSPVPRSLAYLRGGGVLALVNVVVAVAW